ncbi:MAG: ADP-forming succinate--CoA ligase subunit beta [Syntrophobacterales bacterium CG_4_8_14_3_um_filter_58_8]|nr:MAG: succinate--CoA ligase subunit beta [Syntrophaceae bacterium CG2_30_58_14]PIU99954.1 MAG: ADP-forming succinate--CoA ligase subunit beta [Syntrophobacterales bacterium CG03_land_8_20_14_0_80_58_14]PJC75303.1 MAG: ADP-forming succinate--CoA ligase subunit beta [Syntrophobacterales bacterium CG_4_8_14_3_um_filter_58_8]
MKIHEYQAKQLLREYGIPAPRGRAASTPDEAREAAEALHGKTVVKAQIHAGGRGKGGGVKPAASPDEAVAAARAILGMQLVTHQTGPEGKKVRKVLVEEASAVRKELYLSLVVDRSRGKECVVFMASEAGGMDIEQVAATAPEKIVQCAVHPAVGFSPFQARKLSASLGLDAEQRKVFAEIVRNLYRLFLEKDCSLVEINPLAITKEGRLLALDTKINFDDDGLYRHPEIRELRDPDEEEPLEVAAKNAAVNYIKLDGNVGCMVNGAGLAMTTMDMIQMAGGEPANFLDVGGGASAEQIEKAFRILTSDPNVKCILVNIFGGILRCDRVSAGLIQAAKNIEMRLPMVVRLQGTNVEEGRRMLQESGLRFTVADGLYEAAEKAVALVGLG